LTLGLPFATCETPIARLQEAKHKRRVAGCRRRAILKAGNLAMTTTPSSRSDVPGLRSANQLLHLVFGGELKSLESIEFSNLAELDIVGIYPNYAEAYKAWKAAAQRTVDNAQVRYFIVHMHRLLDPEARPASTGPQAT
jgi:Domain of unknown function (DUF4170)